MSVSVSLTLADTLVIVCIFFSHFFPQIIPNPADKLKYFSKQKETANVSKEKETKN